MPLPLVTDSCAGCKNGHVIPADQSHYSIHLPAVMGPVRVLPWDSLSTGTIALSHGRRPVRSQRE